MNTTNSKIAVIGLGYVGLPLSLEFAKHFPVVGFDISDKRISELTCGVDYTKEFAGTEILELKQNSNSSEFKGIYYSSNIQDIADCNVFIVTVPTPVDSSKKPDLSILVSASEMIGSVLKKNDTVIFESTTFPGCTEEVCVPVLERKSKLEYNKDFFVGYSPERINPGDKVNTISKIKKVTSGSTAETAEFVDLLYQKIILAGTYKASSIKVAEASKAIENAQRDLNISFVNELAIIFDRLGIDTNEVLEAASTKWNFLNFKPGLVGGHCIDVDPYYLAYKAEQVGYKPDVILSGRRVNDGMGRFVAEKVIKMMSKKGLVINSTKSLILGFTFKENCTDFRNTKIFDIYRELQEYGSKVTIFDPWANAEEVYKHYGIHIINKMDMIKENFDAIILAVAHDNFKKFDFKKHKKENGIIYDCKAFLDIESVDARL